MFRLTELRMIQWHAYQDETCLLDGTTLITGQNGTGKTTIQDAIQFALVADQTKVRFNKANEHSKRNLMGYCRWKTNANEDGGGGARYQRASSTSYIALRFTDNDFPEQDFVCGVAIDATELSINQVHFLIAEAHVWDLPCLTDNNEPLTVSEFKEKMRQQSCPVILDASKYRNQLRHRLGKLPESFYQLLVKSLDFKPIGQVRPFIFEFLLEERQLETESLIRNVENYHRLNADALEAKRRIEALEILLLKYDSLSKASQKLIEADFILQRAGLELKQQKLHHLRDLVEVSERACLDKLEEVDRLKSQKHHCAHDLEQLVKRLAGIPSFVQLDQIRNDLEQYNIKLQLLTKAKAAAESIFSEMREVFVFLTSERCQLIRKQSPELFRDDPFGEEERVGKVKEFLANPLDPDGRRARSWLTAIEDAMNVYNNVKSYSAKTLLSLNERAEEKRLEHRQLVSGKVTYRIEVEAVLHLLNSKLDARDPIRPFCEYLDINDETWANAVEAMLGENRFTLMVPPEYYERAVKLYQRHKDFYNLPGKGAVKLERTRILDINGVWNDVNSGRRSLSLSLAEKVSTSDKNSRAYADFLIGNIMCVFESSELRGHKRAITPDLMAHQQHSTYRVPAESYKRHYIGKASQTRRIAELENELLELQKSYLELTEFTKLAAEVSIKLNRCFANFKTYMNLCDEISAQSELEKRILQLQRQRDLLRRDAELQALMKERDRLKDVGADLEEQMLSAQHEAGQFEKQAAEAKIHHDDIMMELDAYIASLDDWLKNLGALADQLVPKYERISGQPDFSAQEVVTEYTRKKERRIKRVADEQLSLASAQVRFEKDFDIAQPASVEDNSVYVKDLEKWRDSKLPDYIEQIERARDDAKRQLAEDYLYRLYDSFSIMDEQLSEMNRALRADAANAQWGKYRFTAKPLDKYRKIYNLVQSLGQSRFDIDSFDEATKSEVEEELEKLANSLLSAQMETLDDYVLRDYREFFDFDLVLQREDKTNESFKDVTDAGSGGENQLPYYIAIFAAMYQMYRQVRGSGQPSCGLLLLDEAFSKMDEPRIDSVLGLARHLNLQLVIVTPGDKVATIVPRVETTLLIYRDQSKSNSIPSIKRFNKEMLRDVLSELEESIDIVAAPA